MRIHSSALALLASFSTLARAYVHDIAVGGLNADGTPHLAFTPPYISAAVGDTVRFTFNVKNHSVTQSSFAEPCSKLANAYGIPTGFDSGFRPVAAGTANADLPTFEITVNDTAPIWGYCMQVNPPNPTHCQSGMVFGINPPATGNTFEKFLAMAKASGNNTGSTTTITSTEAQFTSTVVVFEEGETTTITSTEFQFTETASPYWSDAPGTATVPATHTITVGGDPQTTGFRYTPPNITADVGDKVVFEFMVKNHTVTQSSFDEPCEKLKDSYGNIIGFDSGFQAVSNTTTSGFPTFEITVNDTNPIWGYCRQQAANFSHCGVGMVFSVNANPYSAKSFDAFQLNAVRLNGSGFVDPFGNLTAAPSYAASNAKSGKDTLNLASSSGSSSSSDSDSSDLSKLLNTYAPATLGLLAATIVLLIVVLGVGITLLRRSSGSSSSAARSATKYASVPLHVPELGEYTGTAKAEYEEPRYSDRGEYSDNV